MASRPSVQRAPFGATVALAATLAVAAFGVVMPLVLTAIRPVSLGSAFPAQNQRAETLTYGLAYVVLLPGALVAARRLAGALEAGPNGRALSALVGVLTGGLAAAVIAL